MISILRRVLICISLQMFIFRITGGQPMDQSEQSSDVCHYSELDVKVAFTLNKFIVMIADVKTRSGESLSRVAIRVLYVDTPGYYQYQRPERWRYLELKEHTKTILYVFSTTNMEPIFWMGMAHKTQANKQIQYFVSQTNSSEEGVAKEEENIVVTGEEFRVITDKKAPDIIRVNAKIVYKSSTPEADETGFFNLKILYLHFPKDVHILDIVILERKHIQQNETFFLALVYTEEKTEQDHWFFARFYLKAKAKNYSNYAYTYERLDWQFDITLIDNNSVCSDKGSDKVTAVIHISTESDDSGTTYNLIEFYSTHHKKVYVFIKPDGTLHSTQNDTIIDNKEFINCDTETVLWTDETTPLTPTEDSVCLFKEANVSTAFAMDNFLFIIADVKTDKGLSLSRVAIHVFHTTENKTNSKGGPYFEARRWHKLEQIDREKRIGYIFSTTGMDPIFFRYMGDNSDQINNQMHYFFSFPTDPQKAQIVAHEFFNKRVTEVDSEFLEFNYKTVYKFNDPNNDDTGFFNLKLLYYHFPLEIRIIDIVILERKVTGEVKPRYHALVYTEEKLRSSRSDRFVFFYSRYYLSAKSKTYSNARYTYDRLIWKFDYSYNKYNEESRNYSTCEDKTPQKVTAVAHLLTEYYLGHLTHSYVYHLIEFYGTHHRYLQVLMSAHPEAGYVAINGDDTTLTENTIFLNCESHHLANMLPVSNCRQNPKLIQKDSSQEKFIKPFHPWKDPIQSQKGDDSPQRSPKSAEKDDNNWQKVWLILGIIAAIIGIIALISYQVFHFVSSKNQTK